MEILCFFAGVLTACTHSFYPFIFVAIALCLGARLNIFIWFIAALVWTAMHENWVAERHMPSTALIQKATIEGFIESIPVSKEESKSQFQFRLQSLNDKTVYAHALLNCYEHCPDFEPGQFWRLTVKLKRPYNLGNPGHFNYRENLLARHITWTGYLKADKPVLLKQMSRLTYFLSLRKKLAKNIENSQPTIEATGIIEALTLGITSRIEKKQWDLFRVTGTTHLMVISGAHIGLVAGMIFFIVKWCWSRFSLLCLWRPAIQVAAFASFIAAIVYALLAGFAVPSQRALIASLLVMLKYFMSRPFNGWQAWRYALLAILVFEPHAVLLSGFYLSFLAVAILITAGQLFTNKGFKKVILLQLSCLIGLLPFTLYWFSYGAMNGFLANLIAIPLVSYAIVPLALVNLIIAQWFCHPYLFYPLNSLIKLLLYFLGRVNHLALINIQFTMPSISCLLALLAGILLMLVPHKKHRCLAVVFLATGFFPSHRIIKKGDFLVDALDVGQGLSIVLQTAQHVLVFDTGTKFYQGSDMAQMAILPYLAFHGIRVLDMVIISHPDLDHRGGLNSLESRLPIKQLVVDNPSFYGRGYSCHDYSAWQWDEVSFRFLPIQHTFRDKNNSSCVLQVSNQAGKVLFTGDIEMLAEYYLVSAYKKELASDVLFVAHHGSKTSSTPRFVAEVSPKYAIISSGFDNRFHFPHQQTLKTFEKYGVQLFNTANCGMVSMAFVKNKPLLSPQCFQLRQ